MLFINAFFGQIITKKFEKKKRFSTSRTPVTIFTRLFPSPEIRISRYFFRWIIIFYSENLCFTTYFRSKITHFLGLLKYISFYLLSIITISSFVRLHIQDNELCRKYIFRSLFLREISYNVFYLSYHLLNQSYKFFIIRFFMGI